jgi:hypothetical protein
MTARSIVTAASCAVLVPLLSAISPLIDAPTSAALSAVVNAGAAQTAQTAQDLPVRGGRIEPRSASSGLAPAIDSIVRADAGPAWLAWRVDKVPSRDSHRERWNDGDHGRCVLDDDGEMNGAPGISSGTQRLVILARAEAGAITRVTFTDERCTVDVGRRTLYWIADAQAAQSVEWLAARVRTGFAETAAEPSRRGNRRAGEGALPALALHADPAAERALTSFVAADQPRKLRKDAAFWLGASRGASALPLLTRLAREDKDDDFREHLTFVLTLPGDAGIDTLVDLARRDPSPKVRGQALFWLGQKAGARAASALETAVTDDPDSDVRKKAVFAISQLPKDEGVPKLIALARTHRDREVRKQAMFWLGQSGDERAIEFFAEVLK